MTFTIKIHPHTAAALAKAIEAAKNQSETLQISSRDIRLLEKLHHRIKP